MLWSEFIAEVADEAGMPKAQVSRALGAIAPVVRRRLVAGDSVPFPGVGTIDSRWQKPRSIRPIDAARRILLDGRWIPTFRPSKPLKKALLTRTAQRFADPEHQAAWRLAETLLSDLELYHQDRVPNGLEEEQDLAQVDAECGTAFGALWAQARRSFDSEAPAGRDTDLDYMAFAARRRWAGERRAS